MLNKEERWVDAGYTLFAHEGPDGLQVERLARILSLNKSGFYHYFGDTESYVKRLMLNHDRMVDLLLRDGSDCQYIDPDYLNVLVKHKTTVMAQIQLVRNQTHALFYGAYKAVDDKVGLALLRIWIGHVGLSNNPDLALTYYGIVRDMFYSRMNHENFNYEYLRILSNEARDIVIKIINQQDRSIDRS